MLNLMILYFGTGKQTIRLMVPKCLHIVSILSLYCPYTLPILSLYCPYIVPILSLYCPYIVPILSQHCPYIVPILSLYCLYRLGATLANGSRSEEAVSAYHTALRYSEGIPAEFYGIFRFRPELSYGIP